MKFSFVGKTFAEDRAESVREVCMLEHPASNIILSIGNMDFMLIPYCYGVVKISA